MLTLNQSSNRQFCFLQSQERVGQKAIQPKSSGLCSCSSLCLKCSSVGEFYGLFPRFDLDMYSNALLKEAFPNHHLKYHPPVTLHSLTSNDITSQHFQLPNISLCVRYFACCLAHHQHFKFMDVALFAPGFWVPGQGLAQIRCWEDICCVNECSI